VGKLCAEEEDIRAAARAAVARQHDTNHLTA
jgi:hypothetical protein